MKRGILDRLLRGNALVILLLCGLMPLVFLETARGRFDSMAREDMERTSRMVAAALEPAILAGDTGAVRNEAARLAEAGGSRVTVILPDGGVLADNMASPDTMESHRTRPEVIAALEGSVGSSIRTSSTLGRQLVYVAVPLVSGGEVAAVVRVASPYSIPGSPVLQIALRVLALAAVAGLASFLLAFYFSRSIATQVRRLSEVSARVSGGDFTARAGPSTIRELDNLTRSLNETVSRTGILVDELRERNTQLNAVFESIPRPLVLLSGAGSVLLTNSSFSSLAGTDATGCDYRSITSSPELAALLRGAVESGEGCSRVTISGRHWDCSWSRVPFEGQVLLGLVDITDFVDLETVKRDFVLNLSHELRTPLTAIGGFAERIRQAAGGREAEYCDIITRNVERLASLVADAQSLAQLEAGDPFSSMETVDPLAVLAPVAEMFRPKASARGLTLDLRLEPVDPVTADPYRLEQVFVNLVDNAVKYTESGGLTITSSRRGHEAVIEIADTGPGIPAEAVPRLCERFFTVDRSRSRKLGGTGLGLSIVKHVLVSLGGRLEIESTPGAGSVFRVVLPPADPALTQS